MRTRFALFGAAALAALLAACGGGGGGSNLVAPTSQPVTPTPTPPPTLSYTGTQQAVILNSYPQSSPFPAATASAAVNDTVTILNNAAPAAIAATSTAQDFHAL